MDGPGRVKHLGRGEIILDGSQPSSLRIQQLFESASIPCHLSNNINKELWGKFAVNCSLNAISAIGNSTYLEMMSIKPVISLTEELVREVVLIGRHEGIDVTDEESMQWTRLTAATMPYQRSSTAQDLQKGKKTEIDFLNGLIVRKGLQYGIPTPANLSVYALVKLLEGRQ